MQKWARCCVRGVEAMNSRLGRGAADRTACSLRIKERASSAWWPPLWPVKIIMTISFALMILQAIARLLRGIAILMFSTIPLMEKADPPYRYS